MGRGRQKAKATRQAREIKYFSPETDYSALQRELRQGGSTGPRIAPARPEPEPEEQVEDSGYEDSYGVDDYRR